MNVRHHGLAIVGFAITSIAVLSGTFFSSAGCGLNTGGAGVICGDASPDDFPMCADAGPGISPEAVSDTCADNGGECVDVGTGRFKDKAVLLWIGDEQEAPECPDRAPTVDYTGYEDFVDDMQCAECECSSPTCILPNAIGIDPQDSCMSDISDNYAAPKEWDGSCYSAGIIPAGSFSSFALPPATVSECIPSSGKPVGAPTAMAQRSNIVFGGVGFKGYAKACKGEVLGECPSGTTCVQNAKPPPPQFQYCVLYTLPVDDTALPECPVAFPERHLFYRDLEGKRECAPCQCSEPVGSQCVAAISAYQDPGCSDVPAPFFENIAGEGCWWPTMQWPLGAISAKWSVDAPGKCEPSGGEPVGEIKPVDPSVFCCKAP